MSEPKCSIADDCSALYQGAKEQWKEFVKLKKHADAMSEALVDMVDNWRDGISQEAWDAMTAYRKDFPK